MFMTGVLCTVCCAQVYFSANETTSYKACSDYKEDKKTDTGNAVCNI